MKLAFSNIAWQAEKDEEMYAFLHSLGFAGLEIAPTRIFPENPYENLTAVRQFADDLKSRYNLSVCSAQSIWYGRGESIWNKEESETLIAYTEKAVRFAEAASCRNLVFGCPKNRVKPDGESLDTAFTFFKRVTAFSENVIIALEPNPVIYGTNFINTSAEAFGFVRLADCPGLRVNADFGAMLYNGEQVSVLYDNINLVNHIHISEPGLELILKREQHAELASFLRSSGYNGYVSVEMKKRDDIEDVKKAAQYICEVFA